MTTPAERLERVREAIAAAARRAGRRPEDVRLVAVGKGHPSEAIAALADAGQRDFGENYAAELEAKRDALVDAGRDLVWHFIGRVQRNKAKTIATASLVHSVGATRHLEALARERAGASPLRVLLQVNLGDEAQKNGFSREALRREMGPLLRVEGARIEGLMTVPPAGLDAANFFHELRILRDDLQVTHGVALPELSMGMSGDFEVAIAHGATLVRIGTALFGERTKPARGALAPADDEGG